MKITFDRLIYAAVIAVCMFCVYSETNAQDSEPASFESIFNSEVQTLKYRVNGLELRQNHADTKIKSVEDRLSKVEQKVTVPSKAVAATADPISPCLASSGYYTSGELDQWIRARYKPSTRLTHGIMARGSERSVWSHLTDGTHGFKSSQVNGLEYWVAAALHDAEHGKLISPKRSRTMLASSTTVRSKTVVTPAVIISRSYGGNCANGQCSRPTYRFSKRRAVRRSRRQ